MLDQEFGRMAFGPTDTQLHLLSGESACGLPPHSHCCTAVAAASSLQVGEQVGKGRGQLTLLQQCKWFAGAAGRARHLPLPPLSLVARASVNSVATGRQAAWPCSKMDLSPLWVSSVMASS